MDSSWRCTWKIVPETDVLLRETKQNEDTALNWRLWFFFYHPTRQIRVFNGFNWKWLKGKHIMFLLHEWSRPLLCDLAIPNAYEFIQIFLSNFVCSGFFFFINMFFVTEVGIPIYGEAHNSFIFFSWSTMTRYLLGAKFTCCSNDIVVDENSWTPRLFSLFGWNNGWNIQLLGW